MMAASDTDGAVQRWYIDRLRTLSPAERMGQVFDMIEMGFALEEAGLRAREPDLTDGEIRVRLIEQRFGVPAARIAAARR